MVLMMRLELLCESRCEDLAMKLAEVCLRCLHLPGSRFRENVQESQLDYIRDIYLALLFRFKRSQDIIAEVRFLILLD